MRLDPIKFRYIPETWEEEQALNRERARCIEEFRDDVVGDFGEEGYANWALEVELGINDACLDQNKLLGLRQ